jgi:hypothetical protein
VAITVIKIQKLDKLLVTDEIRSATVMVPSKSSLKPFSSAFSSSSGINLIIVLASKTFFSAILNWFNADF